MKRVVKVLLIDHGASNFLNKENVSWEGFDKSIRYGIKRCLHVVHSRYNGWKEFELMNNTSGDEVVSRINVNGVNYWKIMRNDSYPNQRA